MNRYRLVVSERADEDVVEILEWIAQRSSAGASRWVSAFDGVLQEIVQKPQAYSLAPEAEMSGREIRHALFKTRHGRPYRALFIAIDDVVYMIGVRGYGQDLLSLDDLDIPK